MPIGPFPDFAACVAHMTKPKEEGGGGYDEETAKKVCGKMKAELEEGFSWAGSIKPVQGVQNLIRGKALHPIRTVHPNEWPQIREYLEEELQKSAHTLSGKPLLLDHTVPLRGEVLEAAYEDGAIEYIAKLDDQDTLGKIRDGKIKHCSVELDWDILQNVNGVAPRGITFTALSLLENMTPGDLASSVKVWEAIIAKLKEAKGLAPPNPQRGSETEDKVKMEPLKERVWDRAYINDLPDDAFALVQSGGQKDETGRTVPRSLRRLPHHRADGSLDLPHLRNGNARAPQMKDVSEEERNKAIAHLERHKKAAGIGAAAESKEPFKHAWKEQNEVEFQVAPEPTMDELIESIEDIVEQFNARLDAIEARLEPVEAQKLAQLVAKEVQEALKEALKKSVPAQPGTTATPTKPTLPEALISSTGSQSSDLISRKEVLAKIEAIIPPPQVVFSHGQTGGFKRLVENIQKVKREIEGAKAVG